MGWTTADLLTGIRRKARLSDNDPDYDDTALLLEADDEIRGRFTPLILAEREEYYERSDDSTITADQQAYAFPSRAFGSVIREVAYVGSAATDVYPIERVPLSRRHGYAGGSGTRPDAYTILDDKVLLLPTPVSTVGTLRVTYEYRPGKLVKTSAAMQITGITGGVLDGVSVAGWGTSTPYDIIKQTAPFAIVNADLTATGVAAGVSITFTEADLDTDRVAVGDWVTLAEESPIPQIPAFMHTTLALCVAASVLEETGDPGFAAKEAKVAHLMQVARTAMSPRQKGRTMKIVNHHSHLRNRGGLSRMSDGQP